jgi:hypothetical protein
LRKFLYIAQILICFCVNNLKAQIIDDFSDNDFTNNPTWSGDASEFTVNAQQELQLNASIAGSSFLSLPFSSVLNNEWRFSISQNFASSANNFSRFYLIADDDSLENPSLNGYYLQFGENGSLDAVELFKQTGTSAVSVARGADGSIASAFNIAIKVTCDNAGVWNLYVDPAGGNAFQLQASGNDASITSGVAAGWVCKYTVSNISNFTLDNVYIGSPVIDTTPPAILSVSAVSASQVDILFSEPVEQSSAENSGNYQINNSIGQPFSAQRDAVNSSLVHLSVNSLTNGQTYQLTAGGVLDFASNSLPPGSTYSFSYLLPVAASFGDVIINEIMADPSPQVALPNAEYIEIHNTTNSAFDLSSWTISDGTSSGTIPAFMLLPGSYAILTSTSNAPLFAAFGNVIPVPSFPSVNNSGEILILADASGLAVDSVRFDLSWYQDVVKADGGWSLELINITLPSNCSGASNWIASFNNSGGTPGSQNSVWTNTPDIQSPSLLSVSVVNANLLQVCFSEALSPDVSLIPGNWTVPGVGNPSVVTASSNCLLLSFILSFQQGQNYQLSFSSLTDCSGNVLGAGSAAFLYSLAEPFDIVISEIFADPGPQVALPAFEFLELHNTTSNDLSLSGWTLTVGASDYAIPAVTVSADSFIIVTAVSAAPDFVLLGQTIGLPGLTSTSLTNTGTTLILRNDAGLIIHSITYSDQWYNDPVKADGGWSLEMIDPSNPCAGATNWMASVNANGGSPGRTNSVNASNPDNTAPVIASVRVINSNNLEVVFSEPVINAAAIVAADFSVNGGVGAASSVTLSGNPATILQLGFSNAMASSQIYQLSTAFPLIDCAGNASAGVQSVAFSTYEAGLFDVVINEIMADPDPVVGLPSCEFVELYNTSSFPINVFNWKFSSGTSTKILPSATIQPGGFLILCSTQALALLQPFGNCLAVPGLSTSALTNTGTSLSIADTSGRVIHSVFYSDSWYSNEDKDDGGWALEQIDPLNPCGERKNWRVSADVSGGTPGRINSVNALNPDLTPPSLNAVCPVSGNLIEVKFSEILDSALIANPANYSIPGFGSPTSVQLGQPPFRSATLNFPQLFNPSQGYTLLVNAAVKDCAGNSYVANGFADFYFGLAEPYQVQINELMADPDPPVGLPDVEYLEIHNTLNFPVSLLDWRLQSGSSNLTLSCFSIPSNGYLVFTTSGTGDKLFPNSYELAGWSGLTNSGTNIALYDYSGKVISQLAFSDSWYGNSAKQDGGWSLEQIDPNNPCGGPENWAASKDSSGGTPGMVNSLNAPNPDLVSPMVSNALWLDSIRTELRFAESMKLSSLLNAQSYLITPGNIKPIEVTPLAPSFNAVILRFAEPLSESVVYTVKVNSSVSDCAGNSIALVDSARFGKPSDPAQGDLLINEIMFYAKDNSVDFIEIYNKSSKIIDLSLLRLSNWDTINQLPLNAGNLAPEGYHILPGQFLSVTESSKKVNDHYFSRNPVWFCQSDELPALNASGGTVSLVRNDGSLLEFAYFSPEMHFPLLNETKGVSLERISMERPADDRTNWTSASFQVGFATPSYENSQAGIIMTPGGELTLSSEIFSPDNDGFQDVLQVSYSLGFPAGAGTAVIFDVKGREVVTLFRNRLLGSEGVFSWDGTTSDNLKADIGIYVIFLEYFDQTGRQKRLRKAIVVGGKI